MKPREMYSGAAPAAMGMMGQGLTEAGGNIARTIQQGYQQAGQTIGQGLQSVGQAYADYKKMGSEIKAARGFYESLRDSNLLPEGIQQNIDSTINSEGYKHASTADKAAYWNNIKSFAGQSIAHKWSMDKLAAEGKNRMDVTKADIEGRKGLEEDRAYYDYLKSRGFGAGIGGGTGKGQGAATPTQYGTPSEEVPTFDHSVGGSGLDSGDGINNGELPLYPGTKGMGLPSGTEAGAPELLIPAKPVDTFAPTQKKSTLPLVGSRAFTPEEMAIYANMTDQQRGEWHRRNDPVTTQRWSPNNTYVPAIKQR